MADMSHEVISIAKRRLWFSDTDQSTCLLVSELLVVDDEVSVDGSVGT